MTDLNNFPDDDQIVSTMRGTITTSVHGNSVNVCVRLSRLANLLNYTAIALIILGLMFTAERINSAFTSGNVAKRVEEIRRENPCDRFENPILRDKCNEQVRTVSQVEGR